MAAKNRASKSKRTRGRHRRRRDTDRVRRWLQAGAVATGVGAAVISGQGTAWATTEGDTNASDTADSDTTATTGNQDSTPPTGPDPSTGAPSGQGDLAAADDDQDDTDTDSSTSQTATVAAGQSPTATVSAQTNESPDEDDSAPDEELLEDDSEPEEGDVKEPDEQQPDNNSGATAPSASPKPSNQPVVSHQTLRTTTESDAAETTSDSLTTFAAANAQASAVILHPPTATVAVTEVTPPQTPEFRPIRQIVVGVLGLFGFSPDPAPGAPTPNPLLEAIWGLYRRVESVFANERPTVHGATITSSELTDEGDVIVTGAVDFDDYNGDPLHYSSTNGQHGTVVVNNDGTFTYTPTDPAYTGTDTFTITGSDAGFHLHGLFGFFSAGQGHTRTATVSINLTAADNDAPVINDVVSEPGTGNSWTVTVDATDPDGDAITYVLTAAEPTRVTITPVDGQPGKFTVTVTDTAWAKANPGAQVMVTATATDGASTPDTDTLPIGTVSNVFALGDNTFGQTLVPSLPAGVTYTQIATGGHHTVLLRSDGKAVAVGANGQGQLNIPNLPSGVTYTQVAAGDLHTVLLRSDGKVEVFGYADENVPVLPPGVTYTQVAAGAGHTVLLRSDGKVEAFGFGEYGEVDVPTLPAGVTYTQVAAAGFGTMLLRSDGAAVAFGNTGSPASVLVPAEPGVQYTQVATGGSHILLLRSDSGVDAFGVNGDGQTGIGDTPDGVVYTAVAAGGAHTLLLRSDGGAVVFGSTSNGQNVIPTLPAGVTYTQISAGGNVTVLLTSAANTAPIAVDDTVNTNENTPLVIAANTLLGNDNDPDGDPLTITAVWGSTNGTTALGADGTITYTPNANFSGTDTFRYLASDGTLGDVATVTVTVAEVNGAPVINDVDPAPGTGNTWTVTVDTTDPDGDDVTVTPVDTGKVTITPVVGQPGKFTVTVTDTAWAKANPGKQLVVTVSATDGTADAAPVTQTIGTVNNAVTFGLNNSGQLNVPALPPGVTYIQAATGDHHTVLLRSDGAAIAVGANDFGQTTIPTPPVGVTYTQVAVGENQTMLLRSDGTVVAAGILSGDDIPDLPAGVTYTQVAAARQHVVLLRSDGTAIGLDIPNDEGDPPSWHIQHPGSTRRGDLYPSRGRR